MNIEFDDLIRAGRDTDALRLMAKEYYESGRMGHTRKLLLERVADKQDALEQKVKASAAESDRGGCEICGGELPCDIGCDGFCDICNIPEVWKSIHKTGLYNFCPICGKKYEEEP